MSFQPYTHREKDSSTPPGLWSNTRTETPQNYNTHVIFSTADVTKDVWGRALGDSLVGVVDWLKEILCIASLPASSHFLLTPIQYPPIYSPCRGKKTCTRKKETQLQLAERSFGVWIDVKTSIHTSFRAHGTTATVNLSNMWEKHTNKKNNQSMGARVLSFAGALLMQNHTWVQPTMMQNNNETYFVWMKMVKLLKHAWVFSKSALKG